MHARYALLAVILIQTLCASIAGARGSAITGRASLTATAFPCTLDVVLVTFLNATAPPPMSRTDCGSTRNPQACDYHEHDRPYGTNPGQDMRDRYTRRDFERLFSGGYNGLPDFVGDTVTVGNRMTNRDTLPEVFGSVRAYFDSVSNGAFQLHARIINPDDGRGYPRWVELPRTKAHYADIEINAPGTRPDDSTRLVENWFWDDAYTAAWDSVQSWNANITDYSIADLPNDTYDTARRLRHKVLYLYSGATYTARSPAGLLHPQADMTTLPNPRAAFSGDVGYRYVMGERQGFGDNSHGVDEFAGIGMHAHEIGHLLGLNHGGGAWTDPNRYGAERRRDRYGNTANPNYALSGDANQLGWTLMQGGGDQGPIMDAGYTPNGYYIAYRSCPNPINPFYLRDLGWLTPTEIRGPRDNYSIAPGTTHLIDLPGGVEFLLNRRTLEPFGGRYVSFYDYAAHTNEDDPRQGLMIWRRTFGSELPLLIVADERRYRDSRDRDRNPRIPEYHDMLSDPFAVGLIRDPRGGRTEFDQDNVSAINSLTPREGLRQGTSGLNRDRTSFNLALTNITYNRATDMITVDIHMAPPGPPANVTAVVSNGQATLRWRPPAPSDSGPQPPPPSYEYRQSTDGTWGDEIAVEMGSTTARSQMIDGLVTGTDYAFEVRAVNPVGSSDWVSPFVLEGPTEIAEFPEVVAPESGRRTVANYTATDPENDAIEWSLAGTDADDFLLSPSGQLTFQIDPDFEEPTDRNHPPGQDPPTDLGENNTYQVTVQASAGQQSAALDVTVTVTNADDPGTVTLSSQSPQEGTQLTAELTDQDGGITNTTWQWQRRSSPTDAWINAAGTSSQPQPSISIYTPQRGDLGDQLQATVEYDDASGTDQTVASDATEAVVGVPGVPPDFMVSSGRRHVVLRWEAAAANGSPITRYEMQWREANEANEANSEQAWPERTWIAVSGGGTARYAMIMELTDGTEYEFAVRAVNGVGAGEPASDTATPGGPVPLWLTASRGDGQVALEWKIPANAPPIARYEVRQRVSDSGQDWSSWSVVSGGSTARDTTIAGLTNGVTYQFEVQAVNSGGTVVGASHPATATPAGLPGVPPDFMPSAGDGQVVLGWEAADANGSLIKRYEVRWRVAQSGHGWPDWAAVSGGRTARDSTVTGLLNGTEYEFAVRAVNGVGDGEPASDTATPQGPPMFSEDRVSYSVQAGSTFSATLPSAEGAGSYETSGTVPGYVEVNTTTRAIAIQPENPHVGKDEFIWRARNPQGTDDLTVYITVTSLIETEYAYRLHTSGTTAPTFTASASTVPTGWSSSRQTPTSTARYEWQISRSRVGGGSWSPWSNAVVVSKYQVEIEYAYRASQTAPLFDAVASGTPDNWSSSELTWTDAAPRVWRIERTRPSSGGTWSAWGNLEKYSERPAASATFYLRASSTPSTPATQPGVTISTPGDWQTTQPTATATQGVWTTTANRAAGDTQWIFTAPTQETPPTSGTAPGLPRNFAADTGSPLTPGSIDLDWDAPTSGGTPTGYRVEYRFSSGSWLLGATPTLTNASLILSRADALYQFRVRAENSAGNSGWVETTGTTSEPPETEHAYRLHTSGTTAPSFSASSSTVPTGWYSSRQTPTSTAPYEWRISRTRPAGGSWSNWGSATVVSKYTETEYAYRLHTSGTTAPSFTASASGVPSGWSSSRQTPNPHEHYEWRISRSRPAGESWSSWGDATVVSKYTERQTAFRLHTSGTTAPSFTASASGVPSGWSSSRQTPNSHEHYEWRISRSRPAGESWSSWGDA
ncbi:MAG: fibronectin type III domain-containing protein, partial [Gemmatimonadota bacterium]|nr:fibronectin type III domain-containing protein [Gemmatimonadota bacterium]